MSRREGCRGWVGAARGGRRGRGASGGSGKRLDSNARGREGSALDAPARRARCPCCPRAPTPGRWLCTRRAWAGRGSPRSSPPAPARATGETPSRVLTPPRSTRAPRRGGPRRDPLRPRPRPRPRPRLRPRLDAASALDAPPTSPSPGRARARRGFPPHRPPLTLNCQSRARPPTRLTGMRTRPPIRIRGKGLNRWARLFLPRASRALEKLFQVCKPSPT